MFRCFPLLAAGMLLAALTVSPRADEPAGKSAPAGEEGQAAAPAGTWKMTLPLTRDGGREPLWLVKFHKKEAGWTGEVLATAEKFPEGKSVQNIQVTPELLSFTLKTGQGDFPFRVKLPRDGKAVKLFGMATIRKVSMPAEMEKTTLSSFDPFEQTREALARQQPGYEVVMLVLDLLRFAEAKKIKPTEVRAWVEKAVKSAELYGPTYQRETLRRVAARLLEEKGYEPVALQYARRAERMLEKTDSPAEQKEVLDVLAAALEKAGKAAEAKEVNARILKLDFSIKPKTFAGRKSKSDRVVLVEEFTSANDPRSAAASLAFAALATTYKPTEVVLLQYHRNEPQPDPLASPDAGARFAFYEDGFRRSPFGIAFSGKAFPLGAGDARDASEFYDLLQGFIDPLLEKPARGEIKLSADRQADKLSITVDVAKLAETGEDVRLRLALVEDQVAYKGANGVLIHPQVVRSMPGGEAGMVLKEKTFKKTLVVDLAELRKKLEAFLNKTAEKRPFPNKERPLALKKLRVVAFVQNDKTAEVLQAAQADVKGQ